MVIMRHSIPKESKALISFLNKLGTKTKLQSFNSKDILKDLGILRKGEYYMELMSETSRSAEMSL